MPPTRKPPPGPRRVLTPGSYLKKSLLSPGLGRPKKATKKRGSARLGNYRNRYDQAHLQQAIEAVQEENMSVSMAARVFKVPKTTLYDRQVYDCMHYMYS